MRFHLMKTIAATISAVGLATVAAAPSQDAAPAQAQPAAAPAQAQPAAAVAGFQPKNPAEQAVASRLGEFAKAYKAGDASALTALYTDDAVIAPPDGPEYHGKAAIGRMYADSFADGGGLKLEARIKSIRFLTPDVAHVEGRSLVAADDGDGDGDAADHLLFDALMVQKDGAWSIAEIRERAAPAEDVAPYERLKVLEWMVGSWVDQGEHHKVSAEVRWAANRSYLIRTHTAELDGRPQASATMFIGWDPQTGQIKSWMFDSEGGRSEGTWTRTGEGQWIVKASGVMRDGLPTSSTLIHTILNKDSLRTDSVDRVIGDQVEEDVLDLILVRKPPNPGVEAPRAE